MSLKPAKTVRAVKDITQEQAFAEALKRWPTNAIIKKSAVDGICQVGTVMGDGMAVHGRGKSWREAFAQADGKCDQV